ncbi:MAG: CHASE2 domain-containing protein, partial [Telluria sp.]
MFRLPHGLVRASIAAFAILLTAWSQWGPAPSVSFFGNEWLRDVFLKVQKTDTPEPRILVVDIDETSTASLGPWPWPRTRVADLVETLLTHYEARGVALDIVMDEPKDKAGDARLAMLAEHGPVVLAQAFDFQQDRPTPLRQGKVAGATSAYPIDTAVAATGYIGNHAGLANAGKVGNIGFIPDPDGVIRRVPLVTTFEGRAYPALSLALLNCCSGRPPLALPHTGAMRVSFTRDWNAFTVVTAAEILGHEYDVASLKNRLVVIGSSSLGQGDCVATPLGSSRPGLGVQAAMLSTLLDVQEGKAPRPWPGAVLALLFAAGSALLATYAFPRLSAVSSVGLLGASSLGWVGVAYFASRHDPAFSTTGPLATNLFLLAFAVPYQWQLTQRRSRHLLDTLRQYVAPSVVQELLRSDLD